MFIYKAVERHTSPSWYWACVCNAPFASWPLKLSLWNSLVMADRDFPLVSGRNMPTYSADNRQTAPKGTKQYSFNPLCGKKKQQSHWWKMRKTCLYVVHIVCLLCSYFVNVFEYSYCCVWNKTRTWNGMPGKKPNKRNYACVGCFQLKIIC